MEAALRQLGFPSARGAAAEGRHEAGRKRRSRRLALCSDVRLALVPRECHPQLGVVGLSMQKGPREWVSLWVTLGGGYAPHEDAIEWSPNPRPRRTAAAH